jgi:N-acetylglucosamine malate deacetylase 1
MNVLVIAPHPDDEVLGCGGVIARHVAEGDMVHTLIVTIGAPDLFPEATIQQTRNEMRKAHEILGTHQIHELDYHAPRLDTQPQHKVADDFRRIVKQIGAEIVYLPHRGDLHFEHGIIFNAGLVACRPVGGCPTKEILAYETLSETDWAPPFGDDAFIPNLFVDITDFLDQKLRAMACFESQLHQPPNSRSLQALESLARLRGATVSKVAAEAFMVMRQIR